MILNHKKSPGLHRDQLIRIEIRSYLMMTIFLVALAEGVLSL
jgi:hypothetical protein